MSKARLASVVLSLTILALTLIAYSPAVRAGFFFDDRENILEARALHWEDLPLGRWTEALRAPVHPERALANLTFGLNHLWGGLDPRGYHLVNIAIHLLMGVVVAWAAWLMAATKGGSADDLPGPFGNSRAVARLAAVFAAGLFLVHPLNVQAVTYVVQRMASLAALFGLLSFGLYVQGRRSPSRSRSVLWILSAAVSLLLALASKQTALMVPLVICAYEISFHRRSWRSRIRSMVADTRGRWRLAAVAGLAVLAVVLVDRLYLGGFRPNWTETFPGRDFSGWERVLTQARVHWLYLSLMFWPAPSRLNLDHHITVSRSLTEPATLLAVLLWVLALAGVVWLVRKKPRFGFPVLAYMLLHAGESGPVNLELAFEHRMYLPMAFVAILAAIALADLSPKRRLIALAGGVAVLTVLSAATWERNLTWSDKLTFLEDCAGKSPEKFRPQYNLGTYLGRSGRVAEALPHIEKAVELEPENSRARNQLGSAYLTLGEKGKALEAYRLAAQLDPRNAEAQFNLARQLDEAGDHAGALEAYRQFVRVAPPYLGDWVALARVRIEALSSAGSR